MKLPTYDVVELTAGVELCMGGDYVRWINMVVIGSHGLIRKR